jgi:hypothetical protein
VLPVRVVPLPGESIDSWLEPIGRSMGLSQKQMSEVIGYRLPHRIIHFSRAAGRRTEGDLPKCHLRRRNRRSRRMSRQQHWTTRIRAEALGQCHVLTNSKRRPLGAHGRGAVDDQPVPALVN